MKLKLTKKKSLFKQKKKYFISINSILGVVSTSQKQFALGTISHYNNASMF